MRRSAPLRRTTRLVARRALRRTRLARRPRRSRPGDDPAYLAQVRTLPCRARHLGTPCRGRIHAHHAGAEKGTGLKPPDRTAIPLCHRHHLGEWHAQEDAGGGAFEGWTKTQRRAWQDEQIIATQAALSAPPFDPDRDREDQAAERWPISEVQINEW